MEDINEADEAFHRETKGKREGEERVLDPTKKQIIFLVIYIF